MDYIDLIDIKNEYTTFKYIMVVKPEEIKVEQSENDKDFIINQVSEVVTNMEKRNNKKFEHLRDLLEKQVALTKDIQT